MHPTVQAAAEQACGAQLVLAPGLQVPAPSHFETPSRVEVPAVQAAAAQVVPEGYLAQWPDPSQVPLVPQLAAP